jgi:hypothetical protein
MRSEPRLVGPLHASVVDVPCRKKTRSGLRGAEPVSHTVTPLNVGASAHRWVRATLRGLTATLLVGCRSFTSLARRREERERREKRGSQWRHRCSPETSCLFLSLWCREEKEERGKWALGLEIEADADFVPPRITHNRLIRANDCCCSGQVATHVGEKHCRPREIPAQEVA